MGILQWMGIYPFSASERCYGIVGVRGRAYLIGFNRRGIFYRFGARIFSPYAGYFDSVFGLKTGIGAIQINLISGIKDEILPIYFRPDWLHGSIHISHTGSYNFIITAIDPEVFPKMPSKHSENFAELPVENIAFYLNSGKVRD